MPGFVLEQAGISQDQWEQEINKNKPVCQDGQIVNQSNRPGTDPPSLTNPKNMEGSMSDLSNLNPDRPDWIKIYLSSFWKLQHCYKWFV